MDKASNGTDTQVHPPLASKPKPPPALLKPKPSVSKKPVVAAKPTGRTLEKSPSQNGPEPPAKKPSVPDKATHADQSSPTPMSQISKRPKQAPPPLPKTAPKGPVEHKTPPPVHKTPPTVHKTPPSVHKTPPSVHQTPPPLPKTAPRASIKNRGDSLDSAAKQNETRSVVKSNMSVRQDVPNHTVTDGIESRSELESNVENDTEDFTFGNLKSKFTASCENVSKALPKVAIKPKPLPKGKTPNCIGMECSSNGLSKSSENIFIEKSSDYIFSDTEIKHGKSKWFVKDSQEKHSIEPKTISDNTNNSAIQFLSGNQSISDCTVWFNKSEESHKQSPKHSPALPRKPLPRPPPKPVISKSTEDVSSGNKTETLTSSSENSPVKEGQKSVDENIKSEETYCKIDHSETKIDKNTSKPKSEGSPKPLPKPIPRRTAPAPKPRPTPRKRLSLNRLSGSDETFEQKLEQEFAKNTKDKENASTTENNNNLKDDIDVVEESAKDDSSKDKETVAITDSGEKQHYKVIDKVIERSQSHITELELEAEGETVILRKKVTSQEEVSDEELTLEQLKSIEHLLEASDDEEHKFLSRVDLPVVETSVKEEKENTDKMEHKNKVESDSYENSADKSVKGTFDDFDEKDLLEPTSLLDEIEDILTRSYKYSSLTRSGSSPEKKSSPYLREIGEGRTERSRSVDVQSSTPIRPPRPKREQKKLRSVSQVMYDSCGSDTESLPDLSRNRDGSFNANFSLTLGKAKPHPPKPKRHKLLKVQRSQSDVTAMKSVVDKLDTSDKKSPRHQRLMSDTCNIDDSNRSSPSRAGDSSKKETSLRTHRPTRKAPPPPPPKDKKNSSRVSLDTVIPVDERVKSQYSKKDKKGATSNQKGALVLPNKSGSYYHSINDDHIGSSDGEHDYQDIPDENMKTGHSGHNGNHGKGKDQSKELSPPKLPPRNLSNSISFDTSSMSSAGHDFDSVITGGASSTEDMSISSGCFDHDMNSPGFKNSHILKNIYPKTSSPFVKNRQNTGSEENIPSSGLGLSNSSLSDSVEGGKRRPVSGCSDSWSGSHEVEQSSSDEDLDDEEKISRKKEKKLFMIAQEVYSSEGIFVDVLKLLNVDFRLHISKATEKNGCPVIPNEILNRILDYLPQLQIFNEGLLKDLEERISNWEECKGIADIFVKKGPFLKLCSSYIRDFETITSTFDEALKKYPLFQQAVKEFELSPRCASLALKHYMLKPIQRLPQYRLLLQDYMKHLPIDSPEMKDMQTALNIVGEVAEHANENMKRVEYVLKMLEIKRSLIGQFEVIEPGRVFLKEGELMKLSRKEMQPRYFFLFNDVLLYTTPVATGYRLNNALPLAGMKVSVAAQDEYKMEFNIITVQRSFTLHGSTLEERDDWIMALNSAIEECSMKKGTFIRMGPQAMQDKDFVLGHKAPLWIQDARVTMCMLCTCEFTVTWRRHHCRACGWVVCGNCSDSKAPLKYCKYKPSRVCDNCYKTLMAAAEKEVAEKPDGVVKDEGESGNFLTLNGIFERFQKIRRSGRSEKKIGVRPERLKEVSATDQGACMSGYLHKWHKGKKWKRHWYLIKEKVLYTFKATQDTAAAGSMVLLGYEVSRFTDYFEGVEADLLFQLSHANTSPVVFRTDSATATEKWVTVMRESTVA